MTLNFNKKTLVAGVLVLVVAAPIGLWGLRPRHANAAQQPQTTVAALQAAPETETKAAADNIGQAAPDQAASQTNDNTTATPWHTYQVAEGDTLSAVAEQAGVSVDDIVIANQLDENQVLDIGRELIIPNSDGIIHTTTDGDSLWYLATLYQVDLDTILKANPQVNPDTLAPGY